MINNDLLNYIKAALAQGKTKQEISATLSTQGGWNQENIDAGFAAIQGSVPTTVTPIIGGVSGGVVSQNANIQESSGHWLVGLVAFIITLVGTYFYWTLAIPNQTVDLAITAWFGLTLIISILCVWMFAAIFKASGQFSKALLFGGLGGITGLIIQFSYLLHSSLLTSILGLLDIFVLVIILKKVYSISVGKTIGLFICSGLVTAVISIILLFILMFAGLFSLANILNSSFFTKQVNTENTSIVATSTIDQTQTDLQTTTQSTQNVTTKNISNAPVNCGVSKLLSDTSKSILNAKPADFDLDPAFSCLGKNLLNSCTPAYLVSKTGERFEVANTKSSCVLKLTGQGVGGISTANTCVVNDILNYERAHPTPNDPFGISLSNPSLHQGGYVGMFYILASMSSITDENGLTCPGTTLNDVNKAIQDNWESSLPPMKTPTTIWDVQDNSSHTITTIPLDQSYKVNFTDGSSCTLSKTQSFPSVENGQDKLDILRTVDCVGGPRLVGNSQLEGKPNAYGCTIYQSGSGIYDNAALSKPYVQSFTLTCRVAK